MEQALEAGDVVEMLDIVRSGFRRNAGGIANPALYSHSNVGTKLLVQNYLAACVQVVEQFVEKSLLAGTGALSDEEALGVLLTARKCHGQTALALSGGSTHGMT